jgi:hypothetical protein
VTQHVSVSRTAAVYAEGRRKHFLLIPLKETTVKADKWNATKADIWQQIMSVKENDYNVFVILSEVDCYRNSLVQLGIEVICRVFKA